LLSVLRFSHRFLVAGFSDDEKDLQMRFGLLDILLRTLHAALAIPESLKYFVEHIGAG